MSLILAPLRNARLDGNRQRTPLDKPGQAIGWMELHPEAIVGAALDAEAHQRVLVIEIVKLHPSDLVYPEADDGMTFKDVWTIRIGRAGYLEAMDSEQARRSGAVELYADDLGVMKARSMPVEPLHKLRPTWHVVQQFDIHSGHPG